MVTIEVLHDRHNKDELIQLSQQFFAEYQSHHPSFFDIDELHAQDIIRYFEAFMNAPQKRGFVALHDGAIIAYLTAYIKEQPAFYAIKKVGDISGLMVEPSFRKHGVATRLLAAAKQFFNEHGVNLFLVFTSCQNRVALEYYRKNGMEDLYTTL